MAKDKAQGAAEFECGIGIMSGTSCDGLDLALCRFPGGTGTAYELLLFRSKPFPENLRQRLLAAVDCTAMGLAELERDFTDYSIAEVNSFLAEAKAQGHKAQYISNHGHTVFHRVEASITRQMLDGGRMSVMCGLPVVCDFRRQDIALGGQGAPLVPMGDVHLFSEYGACINLGGFANVSFPKSTPLLAYDICPANLVLDHVAAGLGHAFDPDGSLARSGRLLEELLDALNALPYYRLPAPKSLGREWLSEFLMPLLEGGGAVAQDVLHTLVEHIAQQVSAALKQETYQGRVLITGGGARNGYLMERIAAHCQSAIHVPEGPLCEAKEALIFALLGKWRLEGRPNVSAEVTGAQRFQCAGAVYLP